MPSMRQERRTLLPQAHNGAVDIDSAENASCTDDDENDKAVIDGNDYNERLKNPLKASTVQRLRTTLRTPKRSARYQLQRNMRRMFRLLLCVMFVPMMLFLLFYLSIYTNVQERNLPLSDWTYNTSRNISTYVLPLQDTTMLSPHDMCRNKVFLIIVVFSSLHNFVARQNIRETWGNTTEFDYAMFAKLHASEKGAYLEPTAARLKHYRDYLTINETFVQPQVRIVFLVGRSTYESLMGNETIERLHNEHKQYNDIILENFIDSYNNLTLKSVLTLKYMTKHCMKRSAFLMKVDDDTFVHIPNLFHFLLGGTIPIYNDTLHLYDLHSYQILSSRNRLNATKNLLIGYLFCTAHPVSNINTKWYMPYYMYPHDVYPKYLSGAGYLMSMDVVPRLYKAALNTSLLHLEDVYITGMCASAAMVPRRHSPLFSYSRAKKWCSFKGTITQHEMKDDSMLEAYQYVTNLSEHCPAPGKYLQTVRLRKWNNCGEH